MNTRGSAQNSIQSQSRKQDWKRFVPYCCAVAAIAVIYPAVRLVNASELLAVALSAFGALAAYILCRIVQLRGRFTMGMLAIGFPLLVAIGCVGFLQLSPYRQRQRTFDLLTKAQVNYRATPSYSSGEWILDRDGNFLPSWLVKWIGPDSMSLLTSLDGFLEDLKEVPVQDLNSEKLRRITLRSESAGALKPEIVEWLNECREIEYLGFEFQKFDNEDAEQLGKLKTHWSATIPLNAKTRFDCLGMPNGLMLRGERLSLEQAKQLRLIIDNFRPNQSLDEKMGGRAYFWLTLDLDFLNADILRAFRGIDQTRCVIQFQGMAFDQETLLVLAESGLFQSNMTRVQLPDTIPPRPADLPQNQPGNLSLRNTFLSASQALGLVKLFQCQDLRIVDNPNEDFRLEDLQSLWQAKSLKYIGVFGLNVDGTYTSEWKSLNRPTDLEQVD